MCYLIARKIDGTGCLALRICHGAQLAELKKRITDAVGYRDIELVVISSPSAYCEYEPYHFIDTEEAFFNRVLAMQQTTIGGNHDVN